MKTELIETGALIVRAHKGTPFYEAKWRDGRRRPRKRRLGRAWLEPDPRGGWKRRRGRVCRGYLDERSAYREMARVIAEIEAEQQIAPTKREARFEDAVEAWFAHLEFEKRAKPSTLAGYRSLLAHPRPGERGQRGARIMREFAGLKLRSITTQDIQRFLAGIDREDVSARTVNIHRQLLHSIFEHAGRNDVFALRDNPVAGTRKRPEEGARPVETFEPDELRAIAEAARSSLHRTRPAHGYFEETNAEWQRINDQDAALFIVAACTGLRLGELLALRWSDVDLGPQP
jgi:integrase